jgi:type IV pilus assembly protein PilM
VFCRKLEKDVEMLTTSKSFLSIDFGAGSLKVAEFEINEAGSLTLRQYGLKSLGLEGSQDAKREAAIVRALQELFAEKPYGSKNVSVCAPGFHVFSKFVKLPPVDTSKVTQIIQYEAQQNVPFPLEEVVWDFQIIGTTATGELEVLLVAIKTDIVEGLFRASDAAGLRLQLVDVSPAALCNAFRFNYGDLEGCTMVLDIGAKTSNLLFFEKAKFYSRGINIGANSITQDFATEAKLPFSEAERLKIEEGFVSLGGAYAEPENPRQGQISKIARQVMTRLHIQVNQTMQFWRGQQGGSPPQRLFLAGGASVMPYTAQFFAEKLNVPVDYLNPLRNIQIDPAINLEELARVAHEFGEVVGVGLRNLAQCPVELNLMPKSSLKKQAFSQKRPYFIATFISLVLVAFALGYFSYRLAADKQGALEQVNGKIAPLAELEKEMDAAQAGVKQSHQALDQFSSLLDARFQWSVLLRELREVFMATERNTSTQGLQTGLWIESMTSSSMDTAAIAAAVEEERPFQPFLMDEMLMKRYGLGRYANRSDSTPEPEAAPAAEKKPVSTNEISTITLNCRGLVVNQQNESSPRAHSPVVFELARELQSSPLFDAKETQLDGKIESDDNLPPTFKFKVNLKLKQPIKL